MTERHLELSVDFISGDRVQCTLALAKASLGLAASKAEAKCIAHASAPFVPLEHATPQATMPSAAIIPAVTVKPRTSAVPAASAAPATTAASALATAPAAPAIKSFITLLPNLKEEERVSQLLLRLALLRQQVDHRYMYVRTLTADEVHSDSFGRFEGVQSRQAMHMPRVLAIKSLVTHVGTVQLTARLTPIGKVRQSWYGTVVAWRGRFRRHARTQQSACMTQT